MPNQREIAGDPHKLLSEAYLQTVLQPSMDSITGAPRGRNWREKDKILPHCPLALHLGSGILAVVSGEQELAVRASVWHGLVVGRGAVRGTSDLRFRI